MDFTSALPTFVITLREGVEAALVVGIVLAFLKKGQKSYLNNWVYAGIGVGIAVSALVGALFGWLIKTLGAANPQYTGVVEPFLEGAFSVVAIAMLSWMLIWMTRQARFMKNQVEGALNQALTKDSTAGWGVFTLILFAVLREGFETVIFIATNIQQGLFATLGAVAGLASAVVIGILLFKWGIKINIRLFFQVMGVLLLLIVAGLVVSALGHFDDAARSLARFDRKSETICFYYERFARNPSCILGPRVWDTSKILPDEKFPGIILKSMFGYQQNLFLVQAIAYVTFLVTVGGVYFRSLGGKPAKKQIQQTQVSSRSD